MKDIINPQQNTLNGTGQGPMTLIDFVEHKTQSALYDLYWLQYSHQDLKTTGKQDIVNFKPQSWDAKPPLAC